MALPANLQREVEAIQASSLPVNQQAMEDGATYRMLENIQRGQDRCLGGIELMQSC